MREWRILLLLEFQWRMFKVHRRMINWLVGKGMKLSSPVLCMINRRLDNCGVSMARQRNRYESITGEVIKYYKQDEI